MPGKAAKHRDRQVTREIHKLFWRANWQDKWGLLTTLVIQIPAMFWFNIAIPLTIAYGLEAVVNKQFDRVPHYALQVILFAVGYGVLWMVRGVLISRNGVVGGAYLQKQVFANYLNKDYDFYGNTYFGSLGAQAAQLREAYNNGYNILMVLQLPKQLIIVGGGIIVIATKSVLLAAVTLAAMAAVLAMTLAMGSWRLRFRRRLGEANSDVAGKIGDALTQATTVKSFAAETYENKRLDATLKVWQRMQFMSWITASPADGARALAAALACALLLILTARLYQQGVISIAVVALIQLYVIKMITATQDIAEMIKSYEQAMGGAYQPVATMMIEPTITDAAKPKRLTIDQLEIAFRHVGFSYPDAAGKEAVTDFDLAIRKGEKIGLVGYSGSGKTTLTKLLLRFMDVTKGSIAINGVDIRELSQHDLRRAIAYVPQEPLLFHRSIGENIAYGKPDAPRKAVLQAAKAAYVDEFVTQLSNGYDTMVGERGVKLSGGQRQRVAIARALLKDAPILLLDEATSALDSKSEHWIQEAIWKLLDNRTAIVIAHRLSTIQRMDKIVVMDKGKVVQTGTHRQLLKDGQGIYAQLWAHQSGGYIAMPPATEEA